MEEMNRKEHVQDIERTNVMKSIKVKLGVGEIADRAKSAADKQEIVDLLTEELNGHKSRLKPQIDEASKELHRLLEVIREGKEERTVECEMIKDYALGFVKYFYEGQVVDEHNLKDDDRQQVMELPESAVGTQSQEEEIVEVIREETNYRTKTDLVV